MHLTRVMICLLAAILPLTAYGQTAPAAVASTSAAQRACLEGDLIGHTYKMVLFRETPKRREARWEAQFPYQYITFRPLNVYASIATHREVASPKLLNSYLVPIPGHVMHYTLTSDGMLSLLENDILRNSFRCTVVLKNTGSYIKGDVIMNGYTRKAKSELYKLYRRWY